VLSAADSTRGSIEVGSYIFESIQEIGDEKGHTDIRHMEKRELNCEH
jgi:hypothetical protein